MKQYIKTKAIEIILVAFLQLAAGIINAQIGIGTKTPAASAQLEVSSTTKGFLPPRMTQAQRSAIVNPAPGLMIWCTDCGLKGEIQVHNGTTWTKTTGREGKNYYVKQNGDNSKDGLSEENAWKTLGAVNSHMSSFKPGDSILFERGSWFYGNILIGCSGTDANPIIFGAYCTGEKPVFFYAVTIWSSVNTINELHPILQDMSNKERAELPGVSQSRARQIVAGAIVARTVMERLHINELEICPWALREGIVLRWLDWMER